MRILRAATLVAVLATSCGGSVTADDPASTTLPPPGDTRVTLVPDPDDPMDGSLLDRALADLSRRLGVPVSEIVVVSAEEVTWRDGSLGCPEPGKGYIQVLVSGWRALLEVEGTRYWYHAMIGGDPFLCENPQDPAVPPGA